MGRKRVTHALESRHLLDLLLKDAAERLCPDGDGRLVTVELVAVLPDLAHVRLELVNVPVLPLLRLALGRREVHRARHNLRVGGDAERDGVDGLQEGRGFVALLERAQDRQSVLLLLLWHCLRLWWRCRCRWNRCCSLCGIARWRGSSGCRRERGLDIVVRARDG